MEHNFPIFPVGTIFKEFNVISDAVLSPRLMQDKVMVRFPMRLNGMSLDASVIASGNSTFFPAGEIFFSIEKFITVTVSVARNGILNVADEYGRNSIIRHACLIMCKALNIKPFFEIKAIYDAMPVHSGFGTSGAVIGAVCASINEMYGNPMGHADLIKYIANNYGEEIGDDSDNLQMVQCIGGSVASGFSEGGITIIAGDATPIISERLESEVIIGIPKDFCVKSAKDLMELEKEHLGGFHMHGKRYAHMIAYDLLHKGIPSLKNGKIADVCDIIFRHRFEMGSIRNCSFVYPHMIEIADNIKFLYTDRLCRLLSMSSVGPAFFIVPNGDKGHRETCIKAFEEQNLKIVHTSVFNGRYIVE